MIEFECICGGGTVRPMCGSGRTWAYKDIPDLPISDDTLIPTCNSCGEIYIDEEVEKRLLPELEATYRGFIESRDINTDGTDVGTFTTFIKEIELEAELEGPEAVAELDMFRAHFNRQAEIDEEIIKWKKWIASVKSLIETEGMKFAEDEEDDE